YYLKLSWQVTRVTERLECVVIRVAGSGESKLDLCGFGETQLAPPVPDRRLTQSPVARARHELRAESRRAVRFLANHAGAFCLPADHDRCNPDGKRIPMCLRGCCGPARRTAFRRVLP